MAADWMAQLILRAGKRKDDPPEVVRVVANAVTILANAVEWHGVLAFDEFVGEVVTLKPPPWAPDDAPSKVKTGQWLDEDTVRLAAWLQRHFGLHLGTATVAEAVNVVARRKLVHGPRDWLFATKWDALPRIDRLWIDYFGADDSPYVRGVGARFMISAVARICEPGCKVDTTPVLEGEQGIGKSTGLKELAGEQWFFDTPIAMGEKDAYQALRGKWIGELAELESLQRSEVTRAKAFLSATSDRYRPSFARTARDFPRQIVFVATTNAEHYLKDETGARRFWPVACTRVDLEAIRRDRYQLWAEALVRFENGEAWHVDSAELAAACAEEVEQRYQVDPWEAPIAQWLSSPGHPERRRDGVTTAEVLRDVVAMDMSRWSRADEMRAGAVLRRLGWVARQVRREGARVRIYTPKGPRLCRDVTGSDGGKSPKELAVSVVSLPSQPNTGVLRTWGNGCTRGNENPVDRRDSRDGRDRGPEEATSGVRPLLPGRRGYAEGAGE